MPPRMNVHLIDGTYELFRCYYGAPAATAANGTEVGAVRGLLASLTALLRDPAVTHVGIAFMSSSTGAPAFGCAITGRPDAAR